jgi:type I restriction enzyme M protein
MILRKNKKDNKIHFVDASKEFVRMDIKNKLSDANIERIVETVRYKTNIDYFSRYTDVSEVIEKDYDLSVKTYIAAENNNEVIDIVKLNQEIEDIVKKVDVLRKSIDEIIADLEGDDE